jgi:hypothetical protein
MAGGEFVGGTVGRYLNSPIDSCTETAFKQAHALSTMVELACLSRPPCDGCLRGLHQDAGNLMTLPTRYCGYQKIEMR